MPPESKRPAPPPAAAPASPAKTAPPSHPPGGAAHGPGRMLLRALLSERNQWPERAADIDRKVREHFGRRAAVLVLDMCGFSRLTAKRGVISYLSMIAQMEAAATPAVANNGGRVFKQEADNLFAVFPTPAGALEAALDIAVAFKAANSVLPDERDIYAGVGIGYGDLLLVGKPLPPAAGDEPLRPADLSAVEDVFGEEMNGACRLGEDLARRSEILLTPAAQAALPPERYVCEPVRYNIKGERVRAYRFVRKRFGDDGQQVQAGRKQTPGRPRGGGKTAGKK